MTLHDVPALATGADGFIGGHLAERQLAEGACARGFVHYTSATRDRGRRPHVFLEQEAPATVDWMWEVYTR